MKGPTLTNPSPTYGDTYIVGIASPLITTDEAGHRAQSGRWRRVLAAA